MMTPNHEVPPPLWLDEFRQELIAGLRSQLFTDHVETFVLSESPRILAVVVEAEGDPARGILRDIDNAMSETSDATVESVALDIAVCDVAEPGPPGIPLTAPEVEHVTRRWPSITWTGDVHLFGSQ